MSVRLSPSVRISLGLACLTLTVLFAAALLGLVPDHESALLQGRKELCEAIAIHCSAAARRKDVAFITETLDTLVRRCRAILSATVRDANGKMIVEAGDQFAEWGSQIEDRRSVSREGKREDCSIEERGTVSFSPSILFLNWLRSQTSIQRARRYPRNL